MANTLSTTSLAPASCAISATAAMSIDLERRIGRRLHEERLGVLLHRVLPGVEIGAVDQRRGDAEARQPFLDHPAAGAEQRLGGDHVIAGRTSPISAVVTAAMPVAVERAASAPSSAAMRCSNMAHGRVGVARIDVARDLAGEARLALLRALVDVALGQEQRLRDLAELRAQRAGMHQAGFGAVVLGSDADMRASFRPGASMSDLRRPTKNRPEKNSRPGTRVPGLLATYFTWLQAGRLK